MVITFILCFCLSDTFMSYTGAKFSSIAVTFFRRFLTTKALCAVREAALFRHVSRLKLTKGKFAFDKRRKVIETGFFRIQIVPELP